MSRSLIPILVFTAVACAILASGCTQETAVVGNTTLAYGHVYLDGKAASGALVEAMAIDASYCGSAIANDSGAYVLDLNPGAKRYSITATYRGLRQTSEPFDTQSLYSHTHDINLDRRHKAIIMGTTTDSGLNVTDIEITAEPAGGGEMLLSKADANGNFTLYVDPGIMYRLSGSFHPGWGIWAGMSFSDQNDNVVNNIRLGQGEVALLHYHMHIAHSPTTYPTAQRL